MRILIDINHPAHVHYFRNFYKIMKEKGHDLLVVSRNKEIEHQLLKRYKIPFISRGKGFESAIGKFIYLLYADLKIFLLAIRFRPHVFINFLHPYPSHVAWLLGSKSIVFSDTEHAKLHHKLTIPFASQVYTPECYRIDLKRKHIRFKGYMELAYLHPNYFKPDPGILDILKINKGEKYVIIRFVSWAATHDFGHSGMTLENKRKAVHELEKYARVFISSEGKLTEDLEQYRIHIPSDKMHDALHYASLLFGESATMASESSVLGTPSIFIDNDGRGYTDEQEKKYHLVHNFSETLEDQESAIQKAVQILKDPNSDKKFIEARENLLKECIDTTDLMVNEVLKLK
jgi:predicted glycosyltransferase